MVQIPYHGEKIDVHKYWEKKELRSLMVRPVSKEKTMAARGCTQKGGM
jgi:hypothetical protein